MPIRDERLKRLYLDENVTCELSPWLRCCRHSVGVDPHHILGGPFRDDVATHYIERHAGCQVAWIESRQIKGRVIYEGRDITQQVRTWRAELLRDGMRWRESTGS